MATMRTLWTAAVVTAVGAFFVCGAAGQQQTQSPVVTAREDYERSVAHYRQCIAANPNNANACEELHHIMDAKAAIYIQTIRAPTGGSKHD
jgi:hypothetical protein